MKISLLQPSASVMYTLGRRVKMIAMAMGCVGRADATVIMDIQVRFLDWTYRALCRPSRDCWCGQVWPLRISKVSGWNDKQAITIRNDNLCVSI